MDITSHTTIKASAGARIDPDVRRIDVNLDYRGAERGALTSISVSIGQDYFETWRGRALQVKKDGTVGTRNRDAWTLVADDLPADITTSLRAAAREALRTSCEAALAVLSDPSASL